MAARKIFARTIRFRTKGEYDQIKKAAKLSGLSVNQFVIWAAKEVTKTVIDKNPEAA